MYTSEKFIQDIKKVGVENCMFLVPMRPLNNLFGIKYTSSSDPERLVPAKINTERYNPLENYKITLESIYPEYGKYHFYTMDLASMINTNTIQFFVLPENQIDLSVPDGKPDQNNAPDIF